MRGGRIDDSRPGRILLQLERGALARLAKRLPRGVILVSGTHLGHYRCQCDSGRPPPDVGATIRSVSLAATELELRVHEERAAARLAVGGIHNVYNALAAGAAATVLDVALVDVARTLETPLEDDLEDAVHAAACALTGAQPAR